MISISVSMFSNMGRVKVVLKICVMGKCCVLFVVVLSWLFSKFSFYISLKVSVVRKMLLKILVMCVSSGGVSLVFCFVVCVVCVVRLSLGCSSSV